MSRAEEKEREGERVRDREDIQGSGPDVGKINQ